MMISDIKSKVTDLAARTTDQLQQQMEESRGRLQEQFSNLMTLGDDAREKLADYVNQFLDLLPAIEQCGYRTSGLKIGIGIPPSISFLCHNFKDITEDERQAILDQNASKEMLAPIIRALVSADALQARLHKGNYRLNVIEMTLGIPPSVVLELVPAT